MADKMTDAMKKTLEYYRELHTEENKRLYAQSRSRYGNDEEEEQEDGM